MKSNYIIRFAILLTCLVFSTNAFADVKVKARQTVSGQTTENTTYIKGKRQRTEQNMGGMQMVTLTQCDLKRSVQLNPQTQMYILSSWDADATNSTVSTNGNTTTIKKGGVITMTVTIKDTGETRKMFGYNARHLIITTETESSPDACSFQPKTKMVTDGWYIDAAFALDCDYNFANYGAAKNAGGCRDKFETKQIGAGRRGYPVIEKMTMFDANGKETFTMTNEVVELATATLDASLFEIPNGWREAKNQTEMYASTTSTTTASSQNSQNNSSMNSTISNINSTNNSTNTVEAKKDGVIRIGMAGVKTGAVGEGVNAADLAAAIQNSLPAYLKGTKVEIVNLEAKLPSAIETEAKEKQCDYVLFATVSHKKGGGGFGGFGKVLGGVVSQTGIGQTGSQVGNVAGQVATQSISNATANIKEKDEVTLEIKLLNGASSVLSKQFKQKAKSASEDIISPLVEQAASAIVAAVGK